MSRSPAKPENTGNKAAYHHGDLRAHLIETVRQLVEEKGADGFSISEAARRAGVSSAAPYKHFHDKNAIVREVAIDGIRRLGHDMHTAAERAPTQEFAKINAIGQSYVDFARAQPGVFRLMFGLTEGHTDHEEIRKAGEETYGVVIREVAAAMPPGSSEDDIRFRSYMLWTFVHGHSFLQIDGKVDKGAHGKSEADMLSELSKRILG
ncbi:MAG: TetR/AcrR family transcriptional regulator [Pseudomonadota bacterium]